ISPGAARQRATALANALADSVVGTTGQLCTKPNLVLVPGDAPELVAALRSRFAEAGRTELLNDGIAQRFDASLGEWRDRRGARVLVASTAGNPGARSAELVHLDPADDLGDFDEAFGPATALLSYTDLADAADRIAGLPGQLTVSVFAEDDEFTALRPV
ncbi:hypothetical protein SB767_28280, partial [Bacillus sp. SIMBA_069]